MNQKGLVGKYLLKQRETILKALKRAKEARDNAPGAMESHSDTTRSQNEKLVEALEQQLKELERVTKKINLVDKQFPYFEISFSKKKKKFILVPEGLGGGEINGTRLLSESSPLGLKLVGKNTGDEFEFNGQTIEILRIE